jgi:hypothetical protein
LVESDKIIIKYSGLIWSFVGLFNKVVSSQKIFSFKLGKWLDCRIFNNAVSIQNTFSIE